MARKVYTATAPDGAVFKRTTANRTYTHAVIAKGNAKYAASTWANAYDRGEKWGALTWVGRPDLVQAQINAARKRGWENVQAVEAVLT